MFIFWGTKSKIRDLGYVADFCLICRCPRPFRLQRIGLASHVYGVSMGEGKLLGFNRTCVECNSAFGADPGTYAKIATKASPLPSLQADTFPNLESAWGDRMALETSIQKSPSALTPEVRGKLIREPFLLLSPKVERLSQTIHMDKQVGFSVLAAIVGGILAANVVPLIFPDDMSYGVLIIGGAGLAWVMWNLATSSRRKVRREVAPVLAKSLKPLEPTAAELNSVLSELKRHGHKIGSRLKAEDVDPKSRPLIAA